MAVATEPSRICFCCWHEGDAWDVEIVHGH